MTNVNQILLQVVLVRNDKDFIWYLVANLFASSLSAAATVTPILVSLVR